MPRFALLLAALLMSLVPAAAAAAPVVVTFDQLVELAGGKAPTLTTADGVATLKDSKGADVACGTAAGGTLTPTQACVDILRTLSPWDDAAPLPIVVGGTSVIMEFIPELQAKRSSALGGTASIGGTTIAPDGVGVDAKATRLLFNGKRWSVEGAGLEGIPKGIDAADAVVATQARGLPVLLAVNADESGSEVGDRGKSQEDGLNTPSEPKRLPSDWCRSAAGPGHETVCINAATNTRPGGDPDASNGFQIVNGARLRSILRPNTPLVVAIVYDADAKVEVEVEGKRGLYNPGISDQVSTPGDDREAQKGGTAAPAHPGYAYIHKRIAPHLPGTPMDVGVKVTPKGGEAMEQVLEFEVEETFLGAVRMGIGLAYSPLSQSFQATKAPGSSTYEITTRKITPIDAELVLGFAPFLNPGGRGYQSGRDRKFWQRLAPYIGIGVLATGGTASPIEALTSVHLGLEFEFNKASSLALNFVLRRGHVLQEGYRVGGPIAASEVGSDSAVPTKFGLLPAVGIVFNVSPDFLRIARQGSQTFYGN